MNQAFSNMESGMMNKNIKRYVISSVIKRIQNNITRRQHFTFTRLVKI